MVFYQYIDFPEEFLKDLSRMFNVDSETISETHLKTALILLGKDGLHFSSIAMGFSSIYCIIYGCGKRVALVTYKKYYKWYQGHI